MSVVSQFILCKRLYEEVELIIDGTKKIICYTSLNLLLRK